MPDNAPMNLNCPTCGAPLEIDGRSAIVRCKFCRNVSVVPGIGSAQSSPGAALDGIRQLAKGGNQLEAIRKYRELTSAGLKEAREAVQALQEGRLAERSEAGTVSRDPEEFSRLLGEIQELLRSGNKIDAIKRYRETYDISLTRAKYAVERIEAGQTVWPEAGFPTPQAQSDGKAARQGWSCVAVSIAAILVFVLGIVVFALAQPGGPFVPRLYASAPAFLLPSTPEVSPDIVASFYNPDAETRLVGLVSGRDGNLLWRSEALPGDGFVQALASYGQAVYVATGSTLMAFDLSDGSLVWQAGMSDRVYSEHGCMFALDGRVVVLTLDRKIQAFDTRTGQAAWDRSLEGSDYEMRLVNGQLLILDYPPGQTDYQLVFLDPQDGTEARLIAPSCQIDEYSTETLEYSSGLLVDPGEGKLYLAFGSFNGCVQRYDLATGSLDWQVVVEGGFSFGAGSQTLLTDTAFIFNDYQRLLSVDRSGRSVQVLVDDEDYQFVPLAEQSGTLIVRAQRTIGTQRFELWGLAPASGRQLWRLDLSPASPLDPPNAMIALVDDSEPGWTWHQGTNGFLLLQFQASPNQIVMKGLDPADGSLSGDAAAKLDKVSGDFYSIPQILGWRNQILYVLVESNVYAFDPASGDVVFVSK